VRAAPLALRMRHALPVLLALQALLFLPPAASARFIDDLALEGIFAFSIGTDINIKSVDSLDATALNDSLRAARDRGASWTEDPLRTALGLFGRDLTGARRTVTAVYSPTEWEPGRPFNWIRVIVEDGGWLDDSVTGQRLALWFVPDEEGRLVVHRALRAQLCSRPCWRYYSADPCP